MTRRRPTVEGGDVYEAAPVEVPVVDTPVEPTPAPTVSTPTPVGKGKGQGGFDGDPDEIHRKYFVPPAGYVKPKFPSSI